MELPDYNKITFKENPAIPLEEIVPDTPPQAVDLLYKFLVYPSKQRCSARQVRTRKWTVVPQGSDDEFQKLSSLATLSGPLVATAGITCIMGNVGFMC